MPRGCKRHKKKHSCDGDKIKSGKEPIKITGRCGSVGRNSVTVRGSSCGSRGVQIARGGGRDRRKILAWAVSKLERQWGGGGFWM